MFIDNNSLTTLIIQSYRSTLIDNIIDIIIIIDNNADNILIISNNDNTVIDIDKIIDKSIVID